MVNVEWLGDKAVLKNKLIVSEHKEMEVNAENNDFYSLTEILKQKDELAFQNEFQAWEMAGTIYAPVN